MDFRLWLLLCAAVLGSILTVDAVDLEVQDFEFADSDSEVRIVKRQAITSTSDDEDLLNDDEGSALGETNDNLDEEGSGTLPPIRPSVIPAGPKIYRVTLNITNLVWSPSYNDRYSAESENFARSLKQDLDKLFMAVPGNQETRILYFRKQGSVVVTFDVIPEAPADEPALRTALEEALRRGYIGNNIITSEGYQFQSFDETCPNTVGRAPDRLPRAGSAFANLLVNNAFPCTGSVVGWEYYRLVPEGPAYVGVWRQGNNAEFVLVKKTELPAAPSGVRTVEVPFPIPVQRGDFIGLFYPRNAEANVVAQATLEDDVVGSDQLYQSYLAQVYNEDIEEGIPINLDAIPYSSVNTTFSLRALMDYSLNNVNTYTCAADEFSCGDGYCIKAEYVCDLQNDCPSGQDERNCETGPCQADEFTCSNGECVQLFLQCNGEQDCIDGSDEDNCPPPECRADEFRCSDGSCVSTNTRCNGRNDCPFGDDEANCDCGPQMFRCGDGACIPEASLCDAYPDCEDYSDEEPTRCQNVNPTVPPPCELNMFRCDSGICIDLRRKCDGVVDCLDATDEDNCPIRCSEADFQCADGSCIDSRLRCDQTPDCADRSDEAGCECGENEFRCNSGECIDASQRCDRNYDCSDGSDEQGCSCRDNEFRCDGSRCIPENRVCDGRTDCRDQTDEATCDNRCRQDEIRCGSGECVDARRRCDGRRDCRDGFDEQNCPTRRRCPEDQFQCTSGHCLPMNRKCDGRPDCPDGGSDEKDCPTCSPDEFTCEADGQCLSRDRKCDGRRDCRDGSDENDCPCRESEFQCVTDRRCIPGTYRCDGNANCADASDERDCVVGCRSSQFTCDSGECVNEEARCDGRYDCPDYSDERNCASPVRITVTPQQLRVRVGVDALFFCQATGNPTPTVVWIRRTGGAMPPQAQQSNGRLSISNIRPEDAGDYTCQASGTNQEAVARLQVDYIGPATERPTDGGPCGRNEATCPSGQCIPRDYLCDGENDCDDGSDESNCNVPLPCEPNEFRCNNGRCAMKIWRCDGDDDCFDGSDETNCPSRVPGETCRVDEFSCRSFNQCVPLSYQCDTEIDCRDRSDEIGCIEPTIKTPPAKEIVVEINGTFSIICEAVGVPTPLIVWRLNWGNIPSGERVTVTSINGRGILEVRNARPEDAGAYTCEAINNKGSIFAIPDALIIVRRSIGICRDYRFNVDALRESDCVKCFCFQQTTRCVSSSLQLSQITLGSRIELVRRDSLEPTEKGFIQYIPASREFQVRDFSRVLRTGSYYWSLPYQYLSKRLSSYGGELSYSVYYEVDVFDVPTNDPDVIISGNGITLIHRQDRQFQPRTETTVRVPLKESAWERSRDSRFGGSTITDYASREDLMLVLENVTSILIRATYDGSQSLVRLGNVLLTTGVTQNTGLGRASLVEDCSCPAGYIGLSCEDCAPGFYKVNQGRFGRKCVACNCNGHSNECDPSTGVCRNCRDYTTGPYCDQCLEGYIGDPRSSRQEDSCQLCPCPLTNPENQFSRTCAYDNNRNIICTNCDVGYTGPRCNICAEGYSGDPNIVGGGCRRERFDDICDSRGSINRRPPFGTDQCECKANVEGRLCDQCKPSTFHLSNRFAYGCISCFCMGVTQTCQSTAWNRAQITLEFLRGPGGVEVTNMNRRKKVSEGLRVNREARELVYGGFSSDPELHYWSLPQQFLGEKVSAYGGFLRFTLRFRPGQDTSPIGLIDPMVEIGGNDINLVYRARNQPNANARLSFQIPLVETEWLRMDGEKATREHLLMALADLEFILIRATYTQDTVEAGISEISLDVAEDRITGFDRAYPVEQCACPVGYKGLSCEDCDRGYTRSGGGLYLGLCEPCQCNGHSDDCDPETGACRNCRHNTEGANCERCARGYYGDTSRGTVNYCQACPCPLTESPNQFSPSCILDTDGQVTCTSCPAGHTGRRCERCAVGYQGNPLQPGDYCKAINTTCNCDARGTVPNTQCDPNTQQCQCKAYVQGRRCGSCQEGYFYLSRENQQGCLQCFCMGISTQCTSSNYYRDTITPVFSGDGTHNFVLTNRRLSRRISDGFTVDAERNQITFDNFEFIQREQDSLYFQLPPKFRGNKVTSYGGYLRFGLTYSTAIETGRDYMDVDVEFISKQDKRMYYLFRPSPRSQQSHQFDILLREDSFRNPQDGQRMPREEFLAVLADIDAILIRATYHSAMQSITLTDLNMDIAVPTATGLGSTPEVESCVCPEGYTGLSCEECAAGYLRVPDRATGLGRCVRCSCNGHATSCDPETGVCLNCQHNTEGERCERCARGYYGDPSVGTDYDCRVCPCPLTIPTNQFSPTCFLDQDDQVTCDRCPAGYTGRDCGTCAEGYRGSPREAGGRCEVITDDLAPQVIVTPVTVDELLGTTTVFQCLPRGRGPFNVVWSRLDRRPLPDRATSGPGPNYLLTINQLEFSDGGRYVCQVTNAYGTTREYATLTVRRPEQRIRVRIEEPSTVDARLGQTVRFVCVAIRHSTENYVLSWTRNGGGLPAKMVDQNGVLMIPDVDESDLGTYTCTGSDPSGVHRATAVVRLGSREEPPRVRIEPRYLQVAEGDSIQFQCIGEGFPQPKVRWTKGQDGPLPDYAITDESGLFRIESVSMADQSEYYCVAENEAGTASVRTIVYVQRQARVEIIVRRTNVVGVVGTDEELTCYTQGGDQVILTWSREGDSLPSGSTQDNGVLRLPNLQPSYAGNYICTGTTVTGVVGRATVRLTIEGVRSEAPEVRIEPDRQTVGTGTTATFRCIATGQPQPTITWSRAREELTDNQQVNNEVLRIQQATMSDRGLYVCVAENRAGRSQATAVLDIERREAPLIELYPDVQQTLTTGANALFQCRVTGGIPPPTVFWSRAGGRDFTSRTEVKDNGVLMFTDLTTGEQGEYMCSATNEVGTITATASLRVEGPPVIDITPGKTVVSVVGERVNIECIGVGEPVPTVFWRSEKRRRSDVLPEAYASGPGQATLLFENVARTDAGRYICIADNDNGRTQETVDLQVSDRDTATPGIEISGPQQLSVVAGQPVELTCSTRGIPNPRVSWRRPGGVPLPPNHSVRGGVLYIPRVEAEYEGEYICTVTNEQPGLEFSASVYIIVTVTPRVTVSPQDATLKAGERLQLACQPSGPGPFTIEWQKVNGLMSPQARERNGVLEIRQVSRADAGTYRCLVRTQNAVFEEYADIRVLASPTVDVRPRQQDVAPGTTLEIHCNQDGDPPPRVRWEKEGGELPLQHQTRNGVLTIYNIQAEDTGRYICTATNEGGTTRDTAYIRVIEQPGVLRPGPNVQNVNVGERVEFECIVTGASRSVVTWEKVEGPIPPSAVISDNILIINNVTINDSGTYRCLAVNEAGEVRSEVRLFVQGRPSISVQQDYTTAAIGSPVQLRCDASGTPQPRIQWIKEDGTLPTEHSIDNDGALYIPRVREEDAGKYNCLASNSYGQSTYPVYLVVGALVPYFPQNPNSYMAFAPLNDVYMDLDVLLSFRPEATDGMLLYNSQYADKSGDYVCFGLREAYPEFRFDVGTGPAIIRGSRPLELNRWHTVHLKRDRKNGTLMVNDEPAYMGQAPGQFIGLDIVQPLYIGSVPDYNALPSTVGFRNGFVGGVSQLKVKGVDINLGAEAQEIVGVESFPVCRESRESACLNGGTCRPHNSKYGFRCQCPQGWAGERCEQIGERCFQGACGRGRCQNLSGLLGFVCICPMGFYGEGCAQRFSIIDPAFNKTSFISYPKVEDALMSVRIELIFKPRSLDDGIIFYNAQRQDGKQDFIALLIKDGYLEFRFDTGSGPAVLRSRNLLRNREWTKVMADRKGRDGMLVVNGEEPVNEVSAANDRDLFARRERGDVRGTVTGDRTGLNIERPLFLGGVDPSEVINVNTGAYDGFVGCIAELTVNDKKINLVEDGIDSVNIQDCGERKPCDSRPCLNGAVCQNLSPTQYQCTCTDGFMGVNCETQINICVTNNPCRNGGACVVTASGDYTCDCPLGWMGRDCETELRLETSAEFIGDGYAEFASEVFPHRRRHTKETLKFRIKTAKSNGLVFWQGQKAGNQMKRDYLAIAVVDGFLEFRYELGSGSAIIQSQVPIDDNFWHTVVAERLGRDGSLKIDEQDKIEGSSRGNLQVLNVPGTIFVGGVPDMKQYTENQFSENFDGCISEIVIQDKDALHFGDQTVGGMNIRPCPES